MSDQERDQKLKEIARDTLNIPVEYWQNRNPFQSAKELPLVDIMQALQLAYKFGRGRG